MHMGERVKQERERLGYNQTEFAELAHATRKTLFNWESGEASPSGVALAAWSEVGVDVLYVVTGQHSANQPAADAGEQLLIDSYRRCSVQARQNLIQTAVLLASGLSPAGGTGGGQVMQNTGSGSVQIGSVGGNYSVPARPPSPRKRST